VQGGHVAPYEDDLEAYRKLLLAGDGATEKAEARAGKARAAQAASPRPSREKIMELRAEVRKCESRLEKLNEMRDKLAKKLADPALYEPGMAGQAATWQKKYAEVMDGLDRAEELWLAAQERLEGAEGAGRQ